MGAAARTAIRKPRRVSAAYLRSDRPFATDRDRDVYFWRCGSSGSPDEVQLSTHPHPRLTFHCAEHGWYSDKPCMAHDPPPKKRSNHK